MNTIFLKLGGSLITDKTQKECVRHDVLARVAGEIARARQQNPALRLVLGHGSGSFGHVTAAKHGTRQGVQTAAQWRGMAEVGDTAARLNRIVVTALLRADVPVISLPPSASAVCHAGAIQTLATAPLLAALQAGLVPLVYGDVAFDTLQGGTIISTEELLSYLAHTCQPTWFLLAGETTGVYDQSGRVISHITPHNLPDIEAALTGSRGTDVTGGMASKVRSLVALVEAQPTLHLRIFSGLETGRVAQLLTQPELAVGTEIAAA